MDDELGANVCPAGVGPTDGASVSDTVGGCDGVSVAESAVGPCDGL